MADRIDDSRPFWVQKVTEEDGRHFLVVNAHGCPLAKLDHTAQDEAHAWLFATAPAMLDALQMLIGIEEAKHKLARLQSTDAGEWTDAQRDEWDRLTTIIAGRGLAWSKAKDAMLRARHG